MKRSLRWCAPALAVAQLRNPIPAGGESRVIDLQGGDRVIRSVEFWYDARSRGRQAIVRALGRP